MSYLLSSCLFFQHILLPLQFFFVLFAEHLDYRAHILDTSIDDAPEKAGNHVQLAVVGVAHPGLDLYPVGILLFKVFSDVVNNDSLGEVAAKAGQVFQVDAFIGH